MKKGDVPFLDTFPNEMVASMDVLGSGMVFWVLG
jgi:hypothetical protein